MTTNRREAGTVIVGKLEGKFRGIPDVVLNLPRSLNYFPIEKLKCQFERGGEKTRIFKHAHFAVMMPSGETVGYPFDRFLSTVC